MKRLIATATLSLMTLAPLPASAQKPTLVPADANFSVTTNPSRLMQSQLGQTILDRIRVEEPKIDQIIDDLSATAGIDLRTAIGQTVLFGTAYDHSGFALVADIGPTSGNLNGLLLTAPGYESEVYREKTIVHSLPDKGGDGEDRVYCAMPKRPGTGSYYLVASFDPQRTRDMIDLTLDADADLMADGNDDSVLIDAWFTGLPDLARAAQANGHHGPPSVVADLVQQAHLSLSESGDSVSCELTLTMVDGLRAQQMFELMRGGLAMLQLVATAEPEAQPLVELGTLIQIDHAPDDPTVTASFNCSYDQIEKTLSRMSEKPSGVQENGETHD